MNKLPRKLKESKNPYKYGDVLVDKDGLTGEVVGIIGDMVFITNPLFGEDSVLSPMHWKRVSLKFTKNVEEQATPEEETIEINGKKYKVDDIQRLIDEHNETVGRMRFKEKELEDLIERKKTWCGLPE